LVLDRQRHAATEPGRSEFPVNDPARPDWGFFRDVLGLKKVPAPRSETAARSRLRELLVEAAARRPYRLLEKALFTNGASFQLLQQFVECLRREGGGTTVFLDQPAPRHKFADDPYWREALDYILSRLWVMGDGQPLESKQEDYRALGTSTKEPLRAWLPERGGVITYLRARTRHILGEYFEQMPGRNYAVSFDRLREGYLRFAEDGETFRVRRMDLNDAGDVVDVYRGGTELPATLRDDRLIEASRERELQRREQVRAAGAEKPGACSDDERRTDFDRRLRVTKQAHPGDWMILAFDACFRTATYAESRKLSWQIAAARRVIARLAVWDQAIGAPEQREEWERRLRRWRGRKPLVELLPEVAKAAQHWRHQLAGLAGRAPLSTPQEEQIARRLRDRPFEQLYRSVEDTPATREAHAAVAAQQIALQDLLQTVDHEPVLNAAERGDYTYLAQRADEKPDPTLRAETFRAEMRRLAALLCTRLREEGGAGPWLAKTIEEADWDPAQETFGRVLWEAAGKINSRYTRPAPRSASPALSM
jgi:hypothetical protein